MTAVSKGFRVGPLGMCTRRIGCPEGLSVVCAPKLQFQARTIGIGSVELLDSLDRVLP